MHESSANAYREFEPHPALGAWVECFWTRSAEASAAGHQRVLPDGCVDFLFDRSAGRGWLVGAMSRPFDFVPAGAVDLVAVRFRPGGAHGLVRDALDSWTDGQMELGELGAWARALTEEMVEEGASSARVRRLQQVLLQRLRDARADAIDGVLRRVEADPSGFRLEQAADATGLTRQWLRRAIRARSGLGPKELARILRLRRALAALGKGAPIAAVALEAGYADQAHFTREARRIAQATPARLRAGGSRI